MAASSRGLGAGLSRLTEAASSTLFCAACHRLSARSRAPRAVAVAQLLPAATLARRSFTSTITARAGPPPGAVVDTVVAPPPLPAAAAAAEVETDGMDSSSLARIEQIESEIFGRANAHPYQLRAGIILTRPPLLTRALLPFEEAFFFYQKRLNERLTLPFVSSVYYKPNTPAHMDWQLKLEERKGILGRELGGYRGRGAADAWDDELLVGDPLPHSDHVTEVLLRDSVVRFSEDGELIPEEDRLKPERPLLRETEADRQGDVRRLDRKLDRTLYLLVRGRDGGWGFPEDDVLNKEGLHDTAERVMQDAAGINMNTWLVGRVPVAHLVARPKLAADGSVTKVGVKTFFLKARIMAGQADLRDNPLGYTDFKWLAREEVVAALAPYYFKGVRNMMGAR